MNIGPHINRNFVKKGDFKAHFEAAKFNHEYRTFQLFVAHPKNKVIILKEPDIAFLKGISEAYFICAHSSYVAQPWKGNYEFNLEELTTCKAAGIKGLIIHLPKDKDIDEIIEILENMKTPGVRIYLETPAVIKSNYDTPQKINALFDKLRAIDPNLDYFGICIDTAHLHTNGIPLRTYENMRTYIDGLNIPLKCLMFHLNDSERELGKGPDSHAVLCRGKIWGGIDKKVSGLKVLLDFIKLNQLPTILERDENELINVDFNTIAEFSK